MMIIGMTFNSIIFSSLFFVTCMFYHSTILKNVQIILNSIQVKNDLIFEWENGLFHEFVF